jgi:hypothetical protein
MRCSACSASALSSTSPGWTAASVRRPSGGNSMALALRHRSTSFCGISATGMTKSTTPVPIAASGMPSYSASRGSAR